MWTLALLIYFFILLIETSSEFIKCCPHGYAFSDNLQCVTSSSSSSSDNDLILKKFAFDNQTDLTQVCYRSGEGINDLQDDESEYGRNVTEVEKCVDVDHNNGQIYTGTCPVDWRERFGQCDNVFTPMVFWGANIVIFANILYFIAYLVVVVLFFIYPDLRTRAYDKAVLSYNAGELAIVLIMIGMGYVTLCHKPVKPAWIYIVLGLSLQFLLTATVFWLNAICIDMTLVITRFRWIPGSDLTGSEDIRKFRMYAIYAWGGAAIMTTITGFFELCPWIPSSSPLKPNFERFNDGPNYAVIIHVTVVPFVTLFLNTALFVYTTYKIIKIRRSTALAMENHRNAQKRYCVYLRLYILMDAPWIVTVLAATYTDLWILKFYRIVQPIIMLLAILPKKKCYRAIRRTECLIPKISSKSKNNVHETRC